MYLGSEEALDMIFCRPELIGMSDWARTVGIDANVAARRGDNMVAEFKRATEGTIGYMGPVHPIF